MNAILVTGIGELVTNDETRDDAVHSDRLGMLSDAAIVVQDGAVRWVGPARVAPAPADDQEIGRVADGGRDPEDDAQLWCRTIRVIADHARDQDDAGEHDGQREQGRP